jgi:shikimate 5-dehydrogenase
VNAATILGIVGALFGTGGIATAVVTHLKNAGDERAKARDILWQELLHTRTELSALRGEVDTLKRNEITLLTARARSSNSRTKNCCSAH